jgi:ribosome-binding protein aMBF1 (putative translation factor)
LEAQEADLLSISPEPNLDFGEPEVAPKPKATKPEKKEASPKTEKKEEKPAPKVEKKAQPEPVDEIEAVAEKLGIKLEELFKKLGCNKEDIEHTAKKHGMTIEQTLKKLGGIE